MGEPAPTTILSPFRRKRERKVGWFIESREGDTGLRPMLMTVFFSLGGKEGVRHLLSLEGAVSTRDAGCRDQKEARTKVSMI